jgi:Zn-dependent protease
MSQSAPGSFRLFRVAGIDVYAHWTWLLLGYFEVWLRSRDPAWAYSTPLWNLAEFLAIFGIVLLHEFGHALACRSVGGSADRVVLWLLGGAAFVNPPPRPGALLWSIAAGPLVNLALAPMFVVFSIAAWKLTGWHEDITRFMLFITSINFALLIFNMVPIYPLDGGQILHALLWFIMGRVRSLIAVSVIGLVCGAIVIALALMYHEIWLMLVAAFVVLRCIVGLNQAKMLSNLLNGPRHENVRCPACGEAPFCAKIWMCDDCRTRFDTFDDPSCPGCGRSFPTIMCPVCHKRSPKDAWRLPPIELTNKDLAADMRVENSTAERAEKKAQET